MIGDGVVRGVRVAVLFVFAGSLVRSAFVDARAMRVEASMRAPPTVAAVGPGPFERTPLRLLPEPKLVDSCFETKWYTDAAMRTALDGAIDASDLTPAQRASLRTALACPGGGVCASAMPTDLVAGLTPRARALLYPILGRRDDNTQSAPYRFHATDERALRAELPELTGALFDAFRRLTYPQDGYTAFADTPLLCQRLGPNAVSEVIRAINATPSVRLAMRVDAGANLDGMLAWFGRPDLRPRLEALAAAGGGTLDVSELLPAFARAHLYRYPTDEDDPLRPRNCFWTAFNFFDDVPSARLSDTDAVVAELAARYRPVSLADARFGDVVVFEGADGRPIHAAVHVVDDVYYTRNGYTRERPWTLMALADLELRYVDGKPRAYRRTAR